MLNVLKQICAFVVPSITYFAGIILFSLKKITLLACGSSFIQLRCIQSTTVYWYAEVKILLFKRVSSKANFV